MAVRPTSLLNAGFLHVEISMHMRLIAGKYGTSTCMGDILLKVYNTETVKSVIIVNCNC